MRVNYLNCPLQLKRAAAGRKFSGHGSIFGNEDLGGDIVLPGAFKDSLARHQDAGTLPQMFWMHDPSRVPGKWHEMAEDDDGLATEGELAETPLGEEMRVLMAMDAVRGLSIGYYAEDVDWDRHGRRLLKRVDLVEVSIVSLAMNPLARVEHLKARLSQAGEYVPTEREFERQLRSMGCTQLTAKRVMAKMFDGEPARDVRDAGAARDVRRADDEADAAAMVKAIERLTGRMYAAAL